MIVALEEAKRKLVALEDVLAELKNQLRIEEARERAADLERETMVQDFWNDAEKSSKKLQEIKQLKFKVESYEELCARIREFLSMIEASEHEKIAAFSHGGLINTVLDIITGLRQDRTKFLCENCSVTVIELKDGEWRIKLWNYTGEL